MTVEKVLSLDQVNSNLARQVLRDLVIECATSTQVVIKQDSTAGADDGTAVLEAGSNPSGDITVDITNVGVKNGLDTGTEAADTWYYIYLIFNPTTEEVAGLFSISATSPTLPSGFTKKRVIGTARNNASFDLLSFLQIDTDVDTHRVQVYNANITTTPVTVATTVCVSPLSRKLRAMVKLRHVSTTADSALYTVPSSSGALAPRSEIAFCDGSHAVGIYDVSESVITLAENQQFNLWCGQNGQYTQINVNGYTLNL